MNPGTTISGHEGTQLDVTVNSPNKPVVLMLGAYKPTIWNISWTQGTIILGVLASGDHRQAVAGLEKATPTLVSTHDDQGSCGYFTLSSVNLAPLNPFAIRAFRHTVDSAYLATNGKIEVGEPIAAGVGLKTSSDTPPESFFDKSSLPSG